MAKPRIFISSTFYDLKQLRTDLDQFITSLGYDTVRNEEGEIPYGNDEALETYCYNEINQCDMLICIIGNKYGSESRSGQYSITQKELKTAIEEKKQVYIFIDKNVLSEYETYLLNKTLTNVKYKYVDNVKIFQFIEEIKQLSSNNNIKGFDSTIEITHYLKEQFAGLFKRFLDDQNRIKETNIINQLENTSKTLNQLVTLLSQQNVNQADSLNKILMLNNPLIDALRDSLKIQYNFYISAFQDLNMLLSARGFRLEKGKVDDSEWLWIRNTNNAKYEIRISKNLFDDERHLKFINKTDWIDSYYIFTEKPYAATVSSDDLPF